MSLEDEVWQEVFVPLVAGEFNVKPEGITRDTSFKDYNADSLYVTEFTLNLEIKVEEKYRIPRFSIPSDIDPEPRNLGELCAYVAGRIERERPE